MQTVTLSQMHGYLMNDIVIPRYSHYTHVWPTLYLEKNFLKLNIRFVEFRKRLSALPVSVIVTKIDVITGDVSKGKCIQGLMQNKTADPKVTMGTESACKNIRVYSSV